MLFRSLLRVWYFESMWKLPINQLYWSHGDYTATCGGWDLFIYTFLWLFSDQMKKVRKILNVIALLTPIVLIICERWLPTYINTFCISVISHDYRYIHLWYINDVYISKIPFIFYIWTLYRVMKPVITGIKRINFPNSSATGKSMGRKSTLCVISRRQINSYLWRSHETNINLLHGQLEQSSRFNIYVPNPNVLHIWK